MCYYNTLQLLSSNAKYNLFGFDLFVIVCIVTVSCIRNTGKTIR